MTSSSGCLMTTGACLARVLLTMMLAARSIAATPAPPPAAATLLSEARGIATPLTPRLSAAQLGPPPTSSATTSATTTRSATAHGDRHLQKVSVQPDGVLHTVATQVRLFLACVPRWGAVSCLKLEALLLLHGEAGLAGDGSVEGFGGNGLDWGSRHGTFLAGLSEQPAVRDAYLNRMLVDALEAFLADAFDLSAEQSERGMRRRRRWPSPMLGVLCGLGSLIVMAGIAKTAMIAGKALALSLLALALAVMTGFRGGGGGGGGGGAANYEILATGLRRRAGVAGMYLESEPSAADPSSPTAAQSLAYSSHHTRP